jgi:hypothetical protein
MMTKAQLKQLPMIQAHAKNGNLDAAARGLSAMYRAAMSNSSRGAIMAAAYELKISTNPEFII